MGTFLHHSGAGRTLEQSPLRSLKKPPRQFKIVGIIGHPVAHSLSPALHNAWFQKLKLPFWYERWDVPPRHLKSFVEHSRTQKIQGFNVTVPHKEKIVKLLDRCSPAAQELGAVNTVVRQGRRWMGYNTDVHGFLKACQAVRQKPRHRKILLLGAGGAARAVAFAVAHQGASQLFIANRSLSRAQALARDLTRWKRGLPVKVFSLSRGAIKGFREEPDWIVNATSVGLHLQDGLPLSKDYLRPKQFVCDLIYHRQTKLLQAAQRLGAQTSDGRGMLLHQAAEAFRLWTGVRPSLELGRKILKSAKENA